MRGPGKEYNKQKPMVGMGMFWSYCFLDGSDSEIACGNMIKSFLSAKELSLDDAHFDFILF